ncbi:hypothetical protein [Actinomadura sp. 3N508]|uniref:hypothetical protein n=1 Tax=Actinomadura sp. 3N508 TaxID=3375153 RepID=UPI0037A94D70
MTTLELPGIAVPAAASRLEDSWDGWWVISYGLGVDSTAILLRLCQMLDEVGGDRRSITAPDGAGELPTLPAGLTLDRLVVVTAMTGSEWPVHRELVEKHVLPRLARHGIRYVQVARTGPRKGHGITVLDDSRAPSRLYVDGAYRLFDEMVTAGTIPQLGGVRKCSQKAKGVPADEVIALVTGGAPYRQIMGFEAGEQSRCVKDTAANSPLRTGVYPLAAWGWTREMCELYIHAETGVWWEKSACTFCVYALANKEGRGRVLGGFAAAPALAWEPLLMETVAEGLNPSQTLMAGRALYDLMASTPGQEEALRLFEERVQAGRWAVVEVRRVVTGPGRAARAITVLSEGARGECMADLAALADRAGRPVETAGRHSRVWLRRRAEGVFPTVEQLAVVVPATVADKVGPQFTKAWERATAAPMQGPVQTLLELDC